MEYASFKQEIEAELELFWRKNTKKAKKTNPISFEITTKIAELSLAKGKRLRPWLVIAGFGLMQDKIPIKVYKNILLPIGLSLEVFHTFCLIHDDIIDKSPTRRQIPTVHTHFANYFEQNKILDSQHYGTSSAILAGDLALILSQQAIDNIYLDTATKNLYREMQLEVCFGQNDDTLGIGLKNIQSVQEKEIIKMLDYKSGRYSVEKPLLIGASLAKMPSDKQKTLSKIGINLGVVFQLTDDILGVFGQETEVGKSTVSDIQDGKKTLLLLYTYEQATNKEKQKIEKFLENNHKSDEDIQYLKFLMRKYKVKTKVLNYCKMLLQENKKLLENEFDPKNPFVVWLLAFQKLILTRKS